MADVSQGQVYECDFGVERGVELSAERLALVVSRDAYNTANSSVLVVPTTTGGVDEQYIDYYPELRTLGTRASCRNLRAIKAKRLGSVQGTAKRKEMLAVTIGALRPYIQEGVMHRPDTPSEFCPGTVHNGFIPNTSGEIEESWFLILACNEANMFATVVKVDQKPVGGSLLRIPLTATDGLRGMAAYSHVVQPVDLVATFNDVEGDTYVAQVDDRSLAAVARRVVQLTRLPSVR